VESPILPFYKLKVVSSREETRGWVSWTISTGRLLNRSSLLACLMAGPAISFPSKAWPKFNVQTDDVLKDHC